MYLIIATDHRYPSYVSRAVTAREQVSKVYARLGNAERVAREWAEWFGTVTIVAMEGAAV